MRLPIPSVPTHFRARDGSFFFPFFVLFFWMSIQLMSLTSHRKTHRRTLSASAYFFSCIQYVQIPSIPFCLVPVIFLFYFFLGFDFKSSIAAAASQRDEVQRIQSGSDRISERCCAGAAKKKKKKNMAKQLFESIRWASVGGVCAIWFLHLAQICH